MPSIESSGWPLVFKVARKGPGSSGTSVQEGHAQRRPSEGGPSVDRSSGSRKTIRLRTEVRVLEGMQKEALISLGPSGSTWRMVSDEGPYLNGTDLAPFPLAFYTAGMQFSFLSQLLLGARAQAISLDSLTLSQENRYSMSGSFLRGDAVGGAMPPDLRVAIESDAPAETVATIVQTAKASCPAQALMRRVLRNTFALNLNGREVPLGGMKPSSSPGKEHPQSHFEALQPDPGTSSDAEIIRKVKVAEKLFGVEGGAGSSLVPEQKRTLHVHGEARWLRDMLMESEIELIKPIGSTFRFRCDEVPELGGTEQAPPPLAYLTAGVGFCYMTQIGRYAQIGKQELGSYSVVQDNVFTAEGSASDRSRRASAAPVDTHVFIEARQSDEAAQDLVRTGERTCFLHAAMRGEFPGKVSAELNGEPLQLG